jgi:hypothetical protein
MQRWRHHTIAGKIKHLNGGAVRRCFAWSISLGADFIFGDAQRIQEPLHEFSELTGRCIALTVAMLLLRRLRQ